MAVSESLPGKSPLANARRMTSRCVKLSCQRMTYARGGQVSNIWRVKQWRLVQNK